MAISTPGYDLGHLAGTAVTAEHRREWHGISGLLAPNRLPGGLAIAIVLAVSGCAAGARSARPAPSSTPTPTGFAASHPISTASPSANPADFPNPSTASFDLLPVEQPADFVASITCNGSIGTSDPVAVVQLHVPLGATPTTVLRDYANPTSPRAACTFGSGDYEIVQLIDAHHVVIRVFKTPGVYAVVDLPAVRFHWFQIAEMLLAVSPGLDEIAWLSSDDAAGIDQIHLTTSEGDKVVATLPARRGRCGSGDDSMLGAYTHSGRGLYVLDQPSFADNSLLVLQAQQIAMSMLPPAGGWQAGAWPAMAVWSPTSETLFYRQGSDVWRWTSGSSAKRYLPGVRWSYPTITPDGGHLAYVAWSPSGVPHVYLIDLADGGKPRVIGNGPRTLPVFLNSTQLWFKSVAQGVCSPGSDKPLIYNLTDSSEAPSVIDEVLYVWPATSSNH